MSVRILVVDDADVTRRIVRAMVRQSPGLSVCGEAEDGATGVQKFDILKPDVVVLDLSLPDITGLEAARLMTSAIVPKTEAWDLISTIEAEVSRPN
jgi:chemotaxis response regulator CheB